MKHTRAMLPEELPALLQLYTHLHATDDPLPDQAQVLAVWNEAIGNPRCRYFGGFAGGQLVAGFP